MSENEPIKNLGGRPSEFTQEIADKICAELSIGKSLRTVCKAEDMPSLQTIFNWFRTQKGFVEQYALAKEQGSEAWHEELADLGDQAIEHAYKADPKAANAVVSAVKLKADNIKWMMSKMKPKKYGDKLDLSNNGKDFPTPIYGGSAKI